MLLDWALSLMSSDLGIDPGTTRTAVAIAGQGLVFEEPSLVALRADTREVLLDGRAVGAAAGAMLARTPPALEVVRPFAGGRIAHQELATTLFAHAVRTARAGRFGLAPRALLACPARLSSGDKRALVTAILKGGAREALLIEKSRASALGGGLAIEEPFASMVVDVGGGTTEAAVFSLGGIVAQESIETGGLDLDLAVKEHLEAAHNLCIGEQRAERLKIELGSAAPLAEEVDMEVAGRDLSTGLPKKVMVTSEEIREALFDPLERICAAACSTLKRVSAELAGDLYEHGLLLCGGLASLRGLDRLLAEATGIPVSVADEPSRCTARGLARMLTHLDRYRPYLFTEEHG